MGLKKFSWSESFCGKDGTTSISLVCGFISVITGCIGFGTSGICYLLMTLFVSKHNYDPTVISGLQTLMLQSVIVLTIGAAFLGIRRFTPDQPLHDSAKNQFDQPITPIKDQNTDDEDVVDHSQSTDTDIDPKKM